MQPLSPTRLISIAVPVFALLMPCPAQRKPAAGLPPIAPTALVQPAQPPPNQPAATPGQKQPRRADITVLDGQVTVIADNASLNQILRQIGRETGIKITGGVAEERVFGHYGPAPAGDVLAALLDGTASNVLLIPGDTTTAGELVLTPRRGGPTPPNPNAPGFDDEGATDNEAEAPAARPQRQPGVNLFGPLPGAPASQIAPQPAQPAPTQAPASTQAPAPGSPEAVEFPANAPTQSPNGVKTPLEIYQQLQQLRQQQLQSQPPSQ